MDRGADAPDGARPADDIGRVERAQRRFGLAIASLSDAAARNATLLPGWTVAHVLSHVARNADSHRRRAVAAAAGEVVDQYAGGLDGRAREIDDGARRPAAEIVADVSGTAARLTQTWDGLPASAWAAATRDVHGVERPLAALPARRWQELEVHLVDIGVGVTHRDWSEDFVGAWLPRLRSSRHARLPADVTVPAFDDGRDELAWLYGRLHRPGLPTLAPWA